MDPPTIGVKRKRPPTFPHLPADRGIGGLFFVPVMMLIERLFLSLAKKFKKAWVEKTKIKSKWKAQKKKEGLASISKLEIPVYGEQDQDDGLRANETEADTVLSTSRASASSRSHIHPSRSHLHPENASKSKPDSRAAKKQKTKDEQEPESSNIRDLMKEAYSKSSLHTFKADPLKKRVGPGRVQGERGKGQPNMKLRMNAMLAKIKQDYP